MSDGCKHTEGAGHDCDYVNWRNSLIPIAAVAADVECPRVEAKYDETWGRRWDAAFHREMDRLTKDTFTQIAVQAEELDKRITFPKAKARAVA